MVNRNGHQTPIRITYSRNIPLFDHFWIGVWCGATGAVVAKQTKREPHSEPRWPPAQVVAWPGGFSRFEEAFLSIVVGPVPIE